MNSIEMTPSEVEATRVHPAPSCRRRARMAMGMRALMTAGALAGLMVPEMAFAGDEEGIFSQIAEVLETVANDLVGSGWLTWVGVIAVAIGGVLFAVGELSGPFGYVLRVVAGLAVAVGATSLGASFAGGGGTAMIDAAAPVVAHADAAGTAGQLV
ncbi:MAG: TrbC/VirB2 family protein [Aquabacterium sp.]|jgi:type IV secretory pathway VirB2 component (pilin)|nr:TrbC/VirB2 family protein [Aquabacterium sp.]